MEFIITLLSVLTIGSFIWTIIQIVKPELFYKAEQVANLNRKRPKWYLYAGVIGIVVIIILWFIAIREEKTSIWILTAVFSFGALKPLGMVFFYDKFSEKVSSLVGKMKESKTTNTTIIISRAVLTVVLLCATLYFLEAFGSVI